MQESKDKEVCAVATPERMKGNRAEEMNEIADIASDTKNQDSAVPCEMACLCALVGRRTYDATGLKRESAWPPC